jgi:hypothetical protein
MGRAGGGRRDGRLVGIYVVSIAAQAFAGPEFLVDNADDVLSALEGRCSAHHGTSS